ncbi:MAG: hypothetical protein RIR51_2127 [Bacteroidota bacterium]|jgi:ATP-binding cassette subfamily F protein uup
MNVLSANSISRNIGERWIFQNITLGIQQGDKIALIGKNGTGKTTLMECLVGKQIPDNGEIVIKNDIKVGYLPQKPIFEENTVLSDYLYSLDIPQAKAIHDYQIAMNSEDPDLMQQAMDDMSRLDAWDYESRVSQILHKLGITQQEQKIKELSGGQKRRLALAKLLIDQPDIYILDEPTNHLDIETIEWLEELLSAPSTTFLMVSHDRYFLDRVCNRLIELNEGEIFNYKGNYAYFLEKKAEREAELNATISKAKNLYRKELDWMRRQPKARGTKAQYRIDSFFDLEKTAKTKIENKDVELAMNMTRLGNKIMEIEGLTKSFDQRTIINNFTYTFKRKDRIGVVGNNGCGKTTFLNLLTEKIQPDSGHIDKGSTLKIGYYTQMPMDFKEGERPIDIISNIASVISYGKNETLSPSQFLNKFLFSTQTQYAPVEKLSGGELKRLQLMTVLVQNPNFLILDEPTNDLDLDTLQLLEDFLMQFEGCLMLVSHDRYFLDNLVDDLLYLDGSGTIKFLNGNYTDLKNILELAKASAKTKPTNTEAEFKPKEEPKIAEEKPKKLSFKEKKELEDLEKELEGLQVKKKDLEEKLNNPTAEYNLIEQWGQEFQEIEKLIEEKEFRWLELTIH